MRAIVVRVLVCLIALSGFMGAAHPVAAQAPKDPMAAEVGEPVQVSLFFIRAGQVVPVHRVITMPEGKRIAAATLDALLAGPSRQEMTYGVNTEFRNVVAYAALELRESTGALHITFAQGFTDLNWPNAAYNMVGQLVYTMTQFPTVRSVVIHADRAIGDSVSESDEIVSLLDRPLDRNILASVSWPTVIDSPAIGDMVRGPLEVSGTTYAIDGRLAFMLLDMDGNILAERLLDLGDSEFGQEFSTVLEFDPEAARTSLLTLVVLQPDDRQLPGFDDANIPLRLPE
jgi:hypothetical protein